MDLRTKFKLCLDTVYFPKYRMGLKNEVKSVQCDVVLKDRLSNAMHSVLLVIIYHYFQLYKTKIFKKTYNNLYLVTCAL